ncbi:MAG: DoxX family protein [Gammaproteobacteria bacterium]|nr:DoxX family protein [Gammaproteobacteria bacterium]MBU1553524.1 DoxX family protein [Gammaproteobacteria bacterium]MBU2071941.1 DoxX family protein [Gammaproteobacteria bacterium]MBU2181802.1 DoxX family protein [Gammaproteobacteria bacterium]MBU2204303.1 DoxX family protein [Gammaproteobacteria bacterium]
MNSRNLSYFLALIFFASGGAKLLSLPFEVEAFARWGYAIEFMYFTGAIELVGALGLLLPRLSSFTSLCLGGLMLGAIGTHLVHNEWLMFSVASAIAVAAFWRAWSGRKEICQLITILSRKK